MRKFWSLLILAVLSLLAVVPAFAQDRESLPELLANDSDGRFSTLLAAVEAAGLGDALSGDGPFTLLAPTNDAFAAELAYLGLTPEEALADTETLTSILTYHVIPGEYFFRDLVTDPALETLEGDTVQFSLEAGVLTANGVTVGDVDNVASNGVLHTLEDGFLLPPSVAEAAQANRAHVRVAHLSPDAGPVDIYINGEATELTSVSFGTVSDWMEVASGTYRVGVAAAGGAPNNNVVGNVQPGAWVTVAATGIAETRDLRIRFLTEDYSDIAEGQARVTVFHAIPNAPTIDVLVNGNPLIVNLAYPGTNGDNDGLDTRDVAAATYTVSVVATGTTEPALVSADVSFSAGTNYFIAAAGTPTLPQLIVVGTDTTAEGS